MSDDDSIKQRFGVSHQSILSSKYVNIYNWCFYKLKFQGLGDSRQAGFWTYVSSRESILLGESLFESSSSNASNNHVETSEIVGPPYAPSLPTIRLGYRSRSELDTLATGSHPCQGTEHS